MPRILNQRLHDCSKAIKVDRSSPYGNPFIMGLDGDRNSVCDKFDAYLDEHPELKEKIRQELKGKDLACWCSPARCHGDTILKIANE